MRADLIMAGDQEGCADARRATIPDTCGHAIDVPEIIFHFTSTSLYISDGATVGAVFSGHAANIFTPGAVMSGYIYILLIISTALLHIYYMYSM